MQPPGGSLGSGEGHRCSLWESWSSRTRFGGFVLGFWGMFTVPADVKLVRHLPMKGPRQVKQVDFLLLTAGSSSPESSELQPKQMF